MAHSSERNLAKSRFQIEDLQKRISVLVATREDLERQIRKLNDSVPEDEVDANAQKEGYVAYGSYAKSVIARKENLRRTLGDIGAQNGQLADELKVALDALDSFERIKARRLAVKAERALARKSA
jgi:chromosome segregation ATPase